MTLGEPEFRVRLEVAGQAGLRVLARINNKAAPATPGRNVTAACPMTGFAAGLAFHLAVRSV